MALASCQEIHKNITGTAPSPRQRFAVAVQGEDLYLFGGSNVFNDEVSQYYDDLYKLHVGDEVLTWDKVDQVGDQPQGRDGHNLCAVGNKLYLYGGKDNEEATQCMAGLYIFHLGMKAWENVFTPSTAPRTLGHTIDKVKDKLYLFGGKFDDDVMVDMHCLALDDNKWDLIETKGQCPAPRYNHSSAVVRDRYIYYFGGCGAGDSMYGDLFIFDTETEAWGIPEMKYDPPTPRSFHTFVNHRDKDIYLFGGQVENEQTDSSLSGDFYKLSLQDRVKWKKPVIYGSMSPARCGHVAFIVHSHLYIYGGTIEEGDADNFHILKLINPSERTLVVTDDQQTSNKESLLVTSKVEYNSDVSASSKSSKATITKDISTEGTITPQLNSEAISNEENMVNVSLTSLSSNTSVTRNTSTQRDLTSPAQGGSSPQPQGVSSPQSQSQGEFSPKPPAQGVSSPQPHGQGIFSLRPPTQTYICGDRTSTPNTMSPRSCQSPELSELEQDNHPIHSKDTSTSGSKHSFSSSTVSVTSDKGVLSTDNKNGKKIDLIKLRKNTSKMIEEAFDQIDKEAENLKREKMKLEQDKVKIEASQLQSLTQREEMQNEMLNMLENHQKLVEELLQKRSVVQEKENIQLNNIQLEVEQLRSKLINKQ